MSTSNNFNIDRILSSFFFGTLVVAMVGCGTGTEPDDLEDPAAPVETTEQGLISCRQAERQYDAICNMYGNSSQQCATGYDVLHCFCQNCAE